MKHIRKYNEHQSDDRDQLQARVDWYIKIANIKYPNLSADEIIDIIENGNENLRFNSEEEKNLFRKEWEK